MLMLILSYSIFSKNNLEKKYLREKLKFFSDR